MSQFKDVAVGSSVYFWFAANNKTGSAADGSTPVFSVRLAGAAAGAAPKATGTPTLLTHANYTDGLHEIAIDTTGYAAGEYAVFCTLTVSSLNPAGFVGSFIVRAASSDIYAFVSAIKTQTDKMVFTVANKIDADVYTWNGTAVSAPATAGIPEVNVKNINNVAAGTPGATGGLQIVGAAKTGAVATDAGNSATAFKTNLAESDNDYWKDCLLEITSGALIGQIKKVDAYAGATKIITMKTAFTGIPADAVTFKIINE